MISCLKNPEIWWWDCHKVDSITYWLRILWTTASCYGLSRLFQWNYKDWAYSEWWGQNWYYISFYYHFLLPQYARIESPEAYVFPSSSSYSLQAASQHRQSTLKSSSTARSLAANVTIYYEYHQDSYLSSSYLAIPSNTVSLVATYWLSTYSSHWIA